MLSHVDVASGKTEEVIVGPVEENGKDLPSGKNLGNYVDTKGRMDMLQFYKDHKKDLPNLWIIVQREAARRVVEVGNTGIPVPLELLQIIPVKVAENMNFQDPSKTTFL